MIYDTNRICVIWFNRYSCGNFLMNVLSYNKNFMTMLPIYYPRYGITRNTLKLINTKQFDVIRHRAIMQTLPKKQDIRNWILCEFNRRDFWGFTSFDTGFPEFNPDILSLLEKGIYCCIGIHGQYEMDVISVKFPNASVIRIVNDTRVNYVSQNLKVPLRNINKQLPFTDLSQHNIGVEFDIDTLFNEELFFKNIDKLLTEFQIEDKSLDPNVLIYYHAYCKYYEGTIQ